LEQRRFLGDEAFLFGSVDGGLAKGSRAAWEGVLLTAGITDRENGIDGDLHFHDLRHECGSRLAEGKVPLHEIQALLGHASITTTQRYLNATLDSLKRSMSVLEGRSSSGHPTASTEEKSDAQKIA
jgi:integrase